MDRTCAVMIPESTVTHLCSDGIGAWPSNFAAATASHARSQSQCLRLAQSESVLAEASQHACLSLNSCRGSGQLLTSASRQGEKTTARRDQTRQSRANDRPRNLSKADEAVRAVV